ncbi:MAG: choice-of-anchor A family protein [Comamonadaceae bacterium]
MKRSLQQRLVVVWLVCVTLGAAPLALAQSNPLGLSSSLNLLSFGNFFAPSADVQGQVAVGGNASITGYTINAAWPYTQALYGGTALTVGGNLDISGGAVFGNTVVGGSLAVANGTSFHGSVQVAGNLSTTSNWLSATSISYGGTSNLSPWQSPVAAKVDPTSVQTGINFAAEQQRLTSLSQSFDTLANTGTSYMQDSTLVLNANHANVAVFDLTAVDVTHNMRLDNFGPDTTVILNVLGQSVNFSAGGYQNFNLASDLAVGHVLFNLPEATQVSFVSGVYASFLAPLAQFSTAGGGFIGGQVVVDSWSGKGQVNSNPFIAAVPEPESYAMLLAGMGLMAYTLRRRRSGVATF